MKRTALVRRSPLVNHTPLVAHSTLRRTGHIAPVSARRAKENRTYSELRVDFLAGRPRCEFPGGCAFEATDVHHRRGRVGALLLDVAHWSPLCRPHHSWVTEHPAEAVAMGISELRVGTA